MCAGCRLIRQSVVAGQAQPWVQEGAVKIFGTCPGDFPPVAQRVRQA